MNRTLWLAVLVLAIGIAVAANSWTPKPKSDEVRKGLFTVVEGNVKKKPSQQEDWIRAKVKTDVFGGERVRALVRSRAELELAQLDIIRLAPKTTIDIIKLYEETKEKKIETKINLEEGDIWGKVKSVDAQSDFEITSDFAGVAITGTVFRIHHDSTQKETQLKVYSGEVKISNTPEKIRSLTPRTIKQEPQERREIEGPQEVPGPKEITMEEWVYLVRSMQQITVGANGSIKSIGSFSRTDADEQSEWVRWNQQRDSMR